MTPSGRHLVLPLNRPQYVAAPEAFVCALAWNEFEANYEPSPPAGLKLALMYDITPGTTKTLEYRRTRPNGRDLDRFADALALAGLKAEAGSQGALADALARGLRGVRAERARGQSAAPITPSAALLQNLIGFAGSAGTPELGDILEKMFSLGLSRSDDPRTASHLWAGAASVRLEVDPLAQCVDTALSSAAMAAPPAPLSIPRRRAADEASGWRGLLNGTPFAWFAASWVELTRREWVEAMPARAWADWASTVLRMAFGMGYLWEASWYEAIARRIQLAEPASWEELRGTMEPVLPWAPATAGISIRDVRSRLAWRARRSTALHNLLEKWINDESAGDDPIPDVIDAMSMDDTFVRSMGAALGNTTSSASANNLKEAIQFSLKIRDDSGEFADYYGLLRMHGRRWAVIDPGTEWIAVVASLAAGGPRSECDLGTVMASLEALGLRPDLGDAVALLERAGLARGSADADLGVRVGSAY